MCGQFAFFDDTDNREIIEILNEINKRNPDLMPKIGNVMPSELAIVLVRDDEGNITPRVQRFGFPHFEKKSALIINARSETATQKPMFARSARNMRCAVVASGYYEWSKKPKQKYYINKAQQIPLYFAGLYNNDNKFVIVTRDASEQIQAIHNRMPVIMDREMMSSYLLDTDAAMSILRFPPQPHLLISAVS